MASSSEAELPMRHGGAGAPPTAGVASLEAPAIFFPSGEPEPWSSAATAAGVRRLHRQGENEERTENKGPISPINRPKWN